MVLYYILWARCDNKPIFRLFDMLKLNYTEFDYLFIETPDINKPFSTLQACYTELINVAIYEVLGRVNIRGH